MGFKDVKRKVIESLNDGSFSHEARNEIDVKNVLSTGAISKDDVAKILGRSSGSDYKTSPHHLDSTIDVHIVKTLFEGKIWYIKWYFLDPSCVFISVHLSV